MKVELTEKEIRAIIDTLEDKARAIQMVVRADMAVGGTIEGGDKERGRMIREGVELMRLSEKIYYSSIGKGEA